MTISGGTVTCPVTGLRITKPDRWEFVPGPWTRPEREVLVALAFRDARDSANGTDWKHAGGTHCA